MTQTTYKNFCIQKLLEFASPGGVALPVSFHNEGGSMWRRLLQFLCLTLFLTVAIPGQAQEGYLDVFVVKVKPEKRSEFDAIVKKMVDANRKHKGDAWLTAETAFGENNTVYFTSLRTSYADIDKGMEGFSGAVNKAYGQAGAAKLFQDFNNCITSGRSELRRRRADLSSNAPSDPAALTKLIGESRWLRTAMVRLRPGRTADYEAQLKVNKAALAKAASGMPLLISQSVAGVQGTVFYISSLRSSMGGFDTAATPLAQLLGEEGYQKYLKTVSESVSSTETIINRFLPELSNPPEEIVAVAPNFWRPKPAEPKTKPAEAKPKPPTGEGGTGASKKQ